MKCTKISTIRKFPTTWYHCVDRLTPAHLSQVQSLVWEARAKYYDIGLELGLPSDAIDAIEKSSSHRVETIYTEMIKECLKLGLVTQKKLADAVSSRQVGYQYLSSDILDRRFKSSNTVRCKLIFMIT